MKVELGRLADGGLVIMCDAPFPYPIRRVEYYREQRLMMLIYVSQDHRDELMHYELSGIAAQSVETSPSVMIVDQDPEQRFYGYDVPLVQIGV